jgi:hypothetical protein
VPPLNRLEMEETALFGLVVAILIMLAEVVELVGMVALVEQE